MIIKNIPIEQLENNTGQIPGVLENPRDLTNEGFDNMVKSIRDFPQMLPFNKLTVIKNNHIALLSNPAQYKYVVIGGNQRLRALKHLGYTEAPCEIVEDDEWTIDQINQFIIKDNLQYGDWNWESIANEWDVPKLIDWGMPIPVNFDNVEEEDVKVIDKVTMFGLTIETENKMNFDSIKSELDRLKIGYVEFEK